MDSQALYKFGPMVLISIGTYLGGLFTEPVKKWLSNRAERKRLRRALYAELRANADWHQFLTYLSGIKAPGNYPRFAFEQIFRTEVYQEALKQPILFREIREAQTFSLIYEGLVRARTLPEEEQVEWLGKMSKSANDWVKQGRLSRQLLHLPHPLTVWRRKKYAQLVWRNVEPDNKLLFRAPDNLLKRIRAVCRGIPGDVATPLTNDLQAPKAIYGESIAAITELGGQAQAATETLVASVDRRQSTQPGQLERIAFDYLPDTPLSHGWSLVQETRPGSLPSFAALPLDAPIAGGLSITPTGWYGIEYIVPPHAVGSDRLKFIAKFAESGRLYVYVRTTSQDGSVPKMKWIQHTPLPVEPQTATAEECSVTISGRHIRRGWTTYDLSLVDEVHDCFGSQGLGYNALFRIRLRGAISISAIDLCRTRTKAD